MSSDGYNHLKTADSAVDAKFKSVPRMPTAIDPKTTTLDFDGRTYPVAYFSERGTQTLSMTFLVDETDASAVAQFRIMADGTRRGEVLVWDDTFGETFNVALGPSTITPQVTGTKGRLWEVSFQLTRVG